jgi:hypothetical protein
MHASSIASNRIIQLLKALRYISTVPLTAGANITVPMLLYFYYVCTHAM